MHIIITFALNCFKQKVNYGSFFIQDNAVRMTVQALVLVILGCFFGGLLTGLIVISTIYWYVINLQQGIHVCVRLYYIMQVLF